jgi:polysaccharide export outer membrane protein
MKTIGILTFLPALLIGLPSYAQDVRTERSVSSNFILSQSPEPFRENTPLNWESEGYSLDDGDLIFIDIFGLPDYSKEYNVLVDGTLNLPLIGSVYVRGLTLEQAGQAIEQRYQAFVRSPVVSLNIQRPRPLQVAIVGAVNRPGTYSIANVERSNQVNRGDRDQRVTVTTALQEAGGITQIADVRNIQVYRPEPTGESPQYLTANLWDLLRQGDLAQDIVLRDGDTVVVPEADVINNTEITEVASANFSPDTIDVYVVGEVGEPGVVQVKPNTPMNQALLAAGGFDLIRAARGEVRLVRLNPDGTVSDRRVPVDFAAGVNEQTNPAMRPNDTIIVGRSALTSATDTLEQIFSPLDGVFDFIRIIE